MFHTLNIIYSSTLILMCKITFFFFLHQKNGTLNLLLGQKCYLWGKNAYFGVKIIAYLKKKQYFCGRF